MERRNILKSGLLAMAGAVAAVRGAAAGPTPGVPRVVYHLADLDKVVFVLGNIANHYKGMGGSDKVEIALVVHGPALKAFKSAGAQDSVSTKLAGLSKEGLKANACANTMRAMELQLPDLLPGFVVADKGGVVRLAELQGQGYVYLRP